MSPLTLWVIYNNPRDYPGKFVVRRQWIERGEIKIAENVEAVTDSLEEARKALPDGLFRMGRHPQDMRAIEEVWI